MMLALLLDFLAGQDLDLEEFRSRLRSEKAEEREKALKKAGYGLAGKMYLTACPGEIGPEPMEEHRGVAYLGKDIGAHYLFHHGGVAPDYAIAAEGCDFGWTSVGCGYAVFRLRLWGDGIFTPLLRHPERAADASDRLQDRYPNSDWAKQLTGANRG